MLPPAASAGILPANGAPDGGRANSAGSAGALSQQRNMDFLDREIRRCVVYLNPEEFHSTWLGNKAVYRTRMAIADGGELIILAPGVERFGEDKEVDRLIRRYGYRGRDYVLSQFSDPRNEDLRGNMSAAAHLIHSSSDGRFSVTYAVRGITKEIRGVGFETADFSSLTDRYDPSKLHDGFNTLPDGEEIFYISNPALGLWANRDRFIKNA